MAYGKTNLNKAKSRYQSFSGGGFWKAKVGKNVIRILPPVEGSDEFYYEYSCHFNVRGRQKVICTGPKCYICKKIAQLQKNDHEEEANRIRKQSRILMNIVDVNDPDTGVQIYECGPGVFKAILKFFDDEDWGDLTDPESGFDVKITRKGTDFNNTEYAINPARKASELPDMEVLDDMPELSLIPKTLNSKEQKALYNGEELEEDDDDFEDERELEDDDDPEDSDDDGDSEDDDWDSDDDDGVDESELEDDDDDLEDDETNKCFGNFEGEESIVCSSCKRTKACSKETEAKREKKSAKKSGGKAEGSKGKKGTEKGKK